MTVSFNRVAPTTLQDSNLYSFRVSVQNTLSSTVETVSCRSCMLEELATELLIKQLGSHQQIREALITLTKEPGIIERLVKFIDASGQVINIKNDYNHSHVNFSYLLASEAYTFTESDVIQYLNMCGREITLNESTPEKLKSSKLYVQVAIRRNPESFRYASDILRHDKDFILQLIKISESVVSHLSPELRDNKEFMEAAIRLNYKTFALASMRLRRDPDLLGLLLNVQ